MTIFRTNAASYRPILTAERPGWTTLASSYLRRARRHLLRHEVDDYDWATYHQFYGPENVAEKQHYTYDLAEVDFRLIDGSLFTLADAKPVNPWHRVLFEAIVNLPEVASVHEVGSGGGKLIVNLGKILGPTFALGASDAGLGQLALFRQNWPAEYQTIAPFQHDITLAPLPKQHRADVVFCATVLMHIKRRSPYLSALSNLVSSARKHVVLVENWGAHDYVCDLQEVARSLRSESELHLRLYDSGAATALLVSLGEVQPTPAFAELQTDESLRKYL
jgi:hypothetical protein